MSLLRGSGKVSMEMTSLKPVEQWLEGL